MRGGTRTASVKALEETELMELDERILDRLRRRYPRIAARFLQNLSRILGDRLQHRTEQYLAS